MMSCGIRRIVNGCAAHQVVARRDVSEPRTHPPYTGHDISRVMPHLAGMLYVFGWEPDMRGLAMVPGLAHFALQQATCAGDSPLKVERPRSTRRGR